MIIRNAKVSEFKSLGALLVEVYSKLEGFPKADAQPEYYEMLANIGELAAQPHTELLVAVANDKLLGGVVYFSDMLYYGAGGTAKKQKNASGFRLLAVAPDARGLGVGKQLIHACIDKAKAHQHKEVLIHSTKSMQVAWGMYERIGFERAADLDFLQGNLEVFGFRLPLLPETIQD